jgi:steroid 5-alpha reductase family enzyme
MLERGLLDRKPDYADYVQRTSSFVPRVAEATALS